MQRQTTPHTWQRRRQQGFTLINVLVAALIFGIGMLGILRALVGVTSAATQNQFVSSMAYLSNSFSGVAQANPGLLTSPGFNTTYTSANIATAPAVLQPWLTAATSALPTAIITILPGPDPTTGTACAPISGCFVTLTMSWIQVGASGGAASLRRSQVFYYRFY